MGYQVLNGPTPIAIAHRGGAHERPENTTVAFEHAISLGFDYIETDIRATADGVPVVFHDATLHRVTHDHGRIRDLTWAEVARARVLGREPIPHLRDVLRDFPDVRFNFDIKEPNAVEPFVDVVRSERAWDRVCITAFNDARLRRLRRLAGPRVATSLAPWETLRFRRYSRGDRPDWVPPPAACVQVPLALGRWGIVDRQFVSAAHSVGWQVHVWTVNRRSVMAHLLDLGVDGIMTDRPAHLRQLMQEKRVWTDRE